MQQADLCEEGVVGAAHIEVHLPPWKQQTGCASEAGPAGAITCTAAFANPGHLHMASPHGAACTARTTQMIVQIGKHVALHHRPKWQAGIGLRILPVFRLHVAARTQARNDAAIQQEPAHTMCLIMDNLHQYIHCDSALAGVRPAIVCRGRRGSSAQTCGCLLRTYVYYFCEI